MDLVITEMEDMNNVPVYFIKGLTIMDWPSSPLNEGR